MIKSVLTFILFSVGIAQAAPSAISIIKDSYQLRQHELKLQQERAIMRSLGKATPRRSKAANQSCSDWVYVGPSSREEANEACLGVYSMACVEYVYVGPASRVEAAQACRGVHLQECVEFVYVGPSSRVDSARACAGVTDMACVEEAYRGPLNREQSAQSCGYGQPEPGPSC